MHFSISSFIRKEGQDVYIIVFQQFNAKDRAARRVSWNMTYLRGIRAVSTSDGFAYDYLLGLIGRG